MERLLERYEALKNSIVRASSWEQIFPLEGDAAAAFIKMVMINKEVFEGKNSFGGFRVEKLEEGDIHIIYLKPSSIYKKYRISFQRLIKNGNVLHTIEKDDDKIINLISPDIGNITHNYSFDNALTPIVDIGGMLTKEEYSQITGTQFNNKSSFGQFMEGKPATKVWEEIVLKAGHLPQRIGYRIYPDFILHDQSCLLAAHPEYFKK